MNLELLARLHKTIHLIDIENRLEEIRAELDRRDLQAFEWIRRVTA